MGEKEGEFETFKRLITETYPTGIVSIVSDTWDLWKVITEFLPKLKQTILERDGKVVIRPDSGDPVKIICGTEWRYGVVELLWNIFGGTVNKKGYKELDPHIGVIYGDSITLDRAKLILSKLREKGFASSNIVFGIGSYTYQNMTRDTLGFAMKATSGVVKGKRVDIFKDPITDDGTKKSAKGLLRVELDNYGFVVYDQQTEEQEKQGWLQTVFLDGQLIAETTLEEIRERLK